MGLRLKFFLCILAIFIGVRINFVSYRTFQIQDASAAPRYAASHYNHEYIGPPESYPIANAESDSTGTANAVAPSNPRSPGIISRLGLWFQNVYLGLANGVKLSSGNKVDPRKAFIANDDTSLSPTAALKLDSSKLSILDQGMITNLNAELLAGYKPGTGSNNILLLDSFGYINFPGIISSESVNSKSIINGSITAEDLSPNISFGLEDESVTSAKILDGTLINSDIASNAAIANSKLAQITTANKVAGSAVQLKTGGGLVNDSGLSLLTSCASNEILAWSGSAWGCATESDSLATVTSRGASTSTNLTLNGGATLGASQALVVGSYTSDPSAGTLSDGTIFYNSTTNKFKIVEGGGSPKTLCNLTDGGCGTGGSVVSSLDGLTGTLTIANSSGSSSTITINNAAADGSTKGIATFASGNFSASSGLISVKTGGVTTTEILDGTILAGDISSGAVTATKLQSAAADLGAADVTVNFGNTNGSFNTNITTDGSITAGSFSGALTGNAATATALQTARTINGVSFDGSANITVTAAAGTLTGSTLASGVTASSLTSVGTLGGLTVTGTTNINTSGTGVTTIGAASGTGLVLTDAQWSVTDAGAATFASISGALSGNASTATALQTARTINGVSFDGTANITVTAAASTLTGTTLASGVTASSLTSLGTLTGLTLGGTEDAANNIITNIGNSGTDFVASTGALTLAGVLTANGGVTVAANQNLTMSSGSGQFSQTFTTATAANGHALSFANTAGSGTVVVNGIDITPTNTSAGTNTLNAIMFEAGSALGGTDTTNGIKFASATGYTNFLTSPSIVISSAGVITGATGVSSTTGTFSSAVAANGGITFDQSSDQLGAHTLGGTEDANTQIITNIGNTGTDFVASTGALTLAGVLTANGGVTVAASQNLTMSSGSGQFSQTYTTASAGNGHALAFANTAGSGTVVVNGVDITPTNTSAGTNTLNLIMFEAGSALGGSDTTNGIKFASATGYTNFLTTPSIVISSAGNITGAGTISSGAITSSGGVSGTQLTSTVSTGTAPLVVSSTTNVANLNASSLNGATFAAPGAIGSTTASTGKFTTLTETNLLISNTAPTISSGFGTSPSISANNGTASFRVTVGTGGSASSGVIGLPTAATGWNCFATDITTNSSTVFVTKQTASTTTSATIGNFNTSAAAAAWAASDVLAVSCFAY